jgi:uncharacterized membrane protein YfcA
MIGISYVLVGSVSGFVVALTGVGGATLMTTILLFFLGVWPTLTN